MLSKEREPQHAKSSLSGTTEFTDNNMTWLDQSQGKIRDDTR